jgi:hypothetical protein
LLLHCAAGSVRGCGCGRTVVAASPPNYGLAGVCPAPVAVAAAVPAVLPAAAGELSWPGSVQVVSPCMMQVVLPLGGASGARHPVSQLVSQLHPGRHPRPMMGSDSIKLPCSRSAPCLLPPSSEQSPRPWLLGLVWQLAWALAAARLSAHWHSHRACRLHHQACTRG